MITSAFIESLSVQIDQRTYVIEVQVDSVLGNLVYTYLAEEDMRPADIMNARTTALNAYFAALPTSQVTMDNQNTVNIQANLGSISLVLTANQKNALSTALNVINAVKPFVAVFYEQSPAIQAALLAGTPWLATLLANVPGVAS